MEATRERLTHELHQRLHQEGRLSQSQQRELAADWQEQAGELANAEVVDHLEAHTNVEIQAIRAALHRLDDGSYGVCVRCGEGIAPARLEAIPWVATCRDCADA